MAIAANGMIDPFGGGVETPTDFDYPDKLGRLIHISVPRPPQLVSGYSQSGALGAPVVTPESAAAYAAWINAWLPEQAGKPGRTVADLMRGFQTGSEQADFGQAKRYQYYIKTGYHYEYGLRPNDLVTLGTGNAPIYPATTAQAAVIAAQNAAAAQAANAAREGNGNAGETILGFPRGLVLIGLGVAAFLVIKK